jgi:hypothetical protein
MTMKIFNLFTLSVKLLLISLLVFLSPNLLPVKAQDETPDFTQNDTLDFPDPEVSPPPDDPEIQPFPTEEPTDYCQFYPCPTDDNSGGSPFVDPTDCIYGDPETCEGSPYFLPSYIPPDNPGDILGWMNLNYFNFGSLFAMPSEWGFNASTNVNTQGLEPKAENAVAAGFVPVVPKGNL